MSETQNEVQLQTPIEQDLASGYKNLRPLVHPVSRICKDRVDENFDEVEVSIYKDLRRVFFHRRLRGPTTSDRISRSKTDSQEERSGLTRTRKSKSCCCLVEHEQSFARIHIHIGTLLQVYRLRHDESKAFHRIARCKLRVKNSAPRYQIGEIVGIPRQIIDAIMPFWMQQHATDTDKQSAPCRA